MYDIKAVISDSYSESYKMYCQDVFRRKRELKNNVLLEIPVSRKEKRYRTAFTTEELNYLEQEYKTCPYSGQARLTEISNVVKKPEKVIKVWFQNRRSREKKTNGNEKYTDEKNNYDAISARTLEPVPMSNSSKNDSQFANTYCQFPIHQSKYFVTSEKKEINPSNHPNIESYSVRSLNSKNNTSARICPDLNYTKINSQDNEAYNKGNRTTAMTTNVSNIIRNNNVSICKTDLSKIATKMKPGRNILNNNNQQKLPSGNSLASFTTNRQDLLQNFINNKVNKNRTHTISPNYQHPDNVKIMHKKIAAKPQKKCNCKCKAAHEDKTKESAIPYVIVIPCFK